LIGLVELGDRRVGHSGEIVGRRDIYESFR
jgi:hypothetical protein